MRDPITLLPDVNLGEFLKALQVTIDLRRGYRRRGKFWAFVLTPLDSKFTFPLALPCNSSLLTSCTLHFSLSGAFSGKSIVEGNEGEHKCDFPVAKKEDHSLCDEEKTIKKPWVNCESRNILISRQTLALKTFIIDL